MARFATIAFSLALALGCGVQPGHDVNSSIDDCPSGGDQAPSGEGEPDMGVEVIGSPSVQLLRDFGSGAISADSDWPTTENDDTHAINTTALRIDPAWRGARAHIMFVGTVDPSTVSFKMALLGRKFLKYDFGGVTQGYGHWFPLGELNGGSAISGQTNIGLPPLTGVGGAVGILYAEQVDHVLAYDAIAIAMVEVNGTPAGLHNAYLMVEQP